MLLPSDEINNLQHASPTVLKLAVLKTSKNFKFFMYFHEQIIFQFHTTSVQSVIYRLNTGMLIAIYERPFRLFCMIQSDSSDPQRLMFFTLGDFSPLNFFHLQNDRRKWTFRKSRMRRKSRESDCSIISTKHKFEFVRVCDFRKFCIHSLRVRSSLVGTVLFPWSSRILDQGLVVQIGPSNIGFL